MVASGASADVSSAATSQTCPFITALDPSVCSALTDSHLCALVTPFTRAETVLIAAQLSLGWFVLCLLSFPDAKRILAPVARTWKLHHQRFLRPEDALTMTFILCVLSPFDILEPCWPWRVSPLGFNQFLERVNNSPAIVSFVFANQPMQSLQPTPSHLFYQILILWSTTPCPNHCRVRQFGTS